LSSQGPDIQSEISRPSPKQEVVNYFSDINDGQYQTAWDRLPTALQENKTVHPDGFASFEEWWESMTYVDVREVNVAENNSDNAEVNVRIGYNFKGGSFGSNSLRFLLSWDSQVEKWRITAIKIN
jgi:serine/threonine-protein kinase